MPNSVKNKQFPAFFADFRQLLLENKIGILGYGGVEVLIRKRFNFPEPFRLVRKTLLISFSRI